MKAVGEVTSENLGEHRCPHCRGFLTLVKTETVGPMNDEVKKMLIERGLTMGESETITVIRYEIKKNSRWREPTDAEQELYRKLKEGE